MNAAIDTPRKMHFVAAPISPEDQARADFYALIGRLFSAAPDAQLLHSLARSGGLVGDADDALPRAWRHLCQAASVCEPDGVSEEFDALFIGVGKPDVVLYGSYYMAGFMMEKPLARLRAHLADLGLARQADVTEPEDHLSAVAEVMRHLILDETVSASERGERQSEFFSRHLAPWYASLFDLIEAAPKANFYRRAAEFARAFLDLDRQAFEIEV